MERARFTDAAASSRRQDQGCRPGGGQLRSRESAHRGSSGPDAVGRRCPTGAVPVVRCFGGRKPRNECQQNHQPDICEGAIRSTHEHAGRCGRRTPSADCARRAPPAAARPRVGVRRRAWPPWEIKNEKAIYVSISFDRTPRHRTSRTIITRRHHYADDARVTSRDRGVSQRERRTSEEDLTTISWEIRSPTETSGRSTQSEQSAASPSNRAQ